MGALGEKPKLRSSLSDYSDFLSMWYYCCDYALIHSDASSLFSWEPHSWLCLSDTLWHFRFQNLVRDLRLSTYRILSEATVLDRWATRLWDGKRVTHSFSEGPFHSMKDRYFTVVGDYIISLKISAAEASDISSFFDRAELVDANEASLRSVISLTVGTFKILLEKNAKKAKSLRRAFCDYFGLKASSIELREAV